MSSRLAKKVVSTALVRVSFEVYHFERIICKDSLAVKTPLDYGLEEFSTSFNSGKLQYGVIGVRLAKNALTKIVLVHWVSVCVPTSRLLLYYAYFLSKCYPNFS